MVWAGDHYSIGDTTRDRGALRAPIVEIAGGQGFDACLLVPVGWHPTSWSRFSSHPLRGHADHASPNLFSDRPEHDDPRPLVLASQVGKAEMTEWMPMSYERLSSLIIDEEAHLSHGQLRNWDSIKVEPHKWQEGKYGKHGGGFWAAGLMGKQVLWYNDKEDGWNWSRWTTFGHIDEYACNQHELISAIRMVEYWIDERSIR
jgi:hypothetical protein